MFYLNGVSKICNWHIMKQMSNVSSFQLLNNFQSCWLMNLDPGGFSDSWQQSVELCVRLFRQKETWQLCLGRFSSNLWQAVSIPTISNHFTIETSFLCTTARPQCEQIYARLRFHNQTRPKSLEWCARLTRSLYWLIRLIWIGFLEFWVDLFLRILSWFVS